MTQTDRRLIPVSDYVCPALPTDEWFKVLWRRILVRVRPTEKSFIADDQLKRATLRRSPDRVAGCG